MPDVDLNDPNVTAAPPQAVLACTLQSPGQSSPPTTSGPQVAGPPAEQGQEAMLESMIEATGQLDLDDQGYWDFHGHSSGYTFVRRMRQQFGDIFGLGGKSTPFAKPRPLSHIFDSHIMPPSASDSPRDSQGSATIELPRRDVARQLARNTLNDACGLMLFVHRPTFYEELDRIYDTPANRHSETDHKFISLLYAVLAVGSLFADSEQSELERSGYETAIDQG